VQIKLSRIAAAAAHNLQTPPDHIHPIIGVADPRYPTPQHGLPKQPPSTPRVHIQTNPARHSIILASCRTISCPTSQRMYHTGRRSCQHSLRAGIVHYARVRAAYRPADRVADAEVSTNSSGTRAEETRQMEPGQPRPYRQCLHTR
jgi:hypothetical protein